MPNNMKKAGRKYRAGGSLKKAQRGFSGPGGGFMQRLKDKGVGSALSGSFPARAGSVLLDEYKKMFKAGGPVYNKKGKRVPGMYQEGHELKHSVVDGAFGNTTRNYLHDATEELAKRKMKKEKKRISKKIRNLFKKRQGKKGKGDIFA